MRLFLFLTLNIYLIGSLSLNRLNSKYLSDENVFDMNEVIELEDDFVISQIRWTKSKDYDLNYLLGIFEGANDPSFKDAVPLAMIKGEIKVVNYIDINTTNTYKYVRYIPPNKNNTDISPIKIYGEKKLKSEDIPENPKVYQATKFAFDLYIYRK